VALCFNAFFDDKIVLGNLVINNVQKKDEGTYICQAEVNNTHRQENVAFIDVLGRHE